MWLMISVDRIHQIMEQYDLTMDEVLYAHTLYDPAIDDSMEELYELVSDHNLISTTAELTHLLTHV
jgi:hypothetical protein